MVAWTFAQSLNPLQSVKFQCLDLVSGQTLGWLEADDAMLGGESSMLNISEAPREYFSCPNEEKGCGLSQILQKPEDVPKKYYLSAKACQGILRRAKERGKELPAPLKRALEQQAMSTMGGAKVVKIRSGKDDGTAGKGALIGIEQSFTLGCSNDQTLFQEKVTSTMGGQNETIYDIKNKSLGAVDCHGKSPTLTQYMGTGGNNVPIKVESIPEAVIMGHDERSSRFHTGTTDPLTACDYKQPPIVAQMSIEGGQKCWSASKADYMAKFSKNQAGALVATDWKDPPIVVTENKSLEVCVQEMDEDSTDKMPATS